MFTEMKSYWSFLLETVKRPALAYALARSARQHRQVEAEFRRRMLALCGDRAELTFPHVGLPPEQYWQRNFFSILFLSIFDTLGISPERRRLYGLALHSLRGIVTATDNILDDESKGAVRLNMTGGNVMPNVLLVLLQDGLLHQVLRELGDEAAAGQTFHALTAALMDIACNECHEESAVETVLRPAEVLHDVHSLRGGALLELAFVAPELNEPDLARGVRSARHSVYLLGLALQVLDDVTDLAEDVERRNHNVLRSWIVHEAPDGPLTDAQLLRRPASALEAPHRAFPRATAEVLYLAVEIALDGFERLRGLGYPIDRSGGLQLLSVLFRLRGLGELWDFRLAPQGALTPEQIARVRRVRRGSSGRVAVAAGDRAAV